MYTLAVQREFSAQHYLVGGDWGAENAPHTHHYRLELRIDAHSLDAHGYCVDILQVEKALDHMVSSYRGGMLNDMEAFAGLNPSIENFARIACHALAQALAAPNVTAFSVRIWENDIAWAAYRLPVNAAL